MSSVDIIEKAGGLLLLRWATRCEAPGRDIVVWAWPEDGISTQSR
jgi:hypothetical protein